MRDLFPRMPTELMLFTEPWPLDRMQREMERTFDHWMRELNLDLGDSWVPFPFFEAGPVVEMEENEKEVLITAELPGLDKEDFKVELEGDRLTIRGAQKVEEPKREGRQVQSRYGAFHRTFILPSEVKPEAIKAEYKNGELRIHLPKPEEVKAKPIEIQVA